MEQAEAGSGLQDVPGTQQRQESTHEHGNGVRPEEVNATSGPGDVEKRQQPARGKRKVENLAVCASPGEPQARRKKTEGSERESIGGMLRMAVVDHQLGLSLNLLLLAALTWLLFPSLRHKVAGFFWLQYPTEGQPGRFGQGPRDQYLVASFVVFFTGLRAATMDHLLLPLAANLGIRQKKAKIRFAEQAYLLLYYTFYWSLGLWIFVKDTPTSDATTITGWVHDLLLSIWQDYPRLAIGTAEKLYYLSQTAFWIQQIFVINIEERRKDHWQMLAHHIVTVGLLVFSYGYRQLRPGNAILVLMDIVDLIFPLAKILRYLGWQTACDIAFGAFVVTWLLARHVGYLLICWSLYHDVNTVAMIFGTYSTVDGSRITPDSGDRMLDSILQPLTKPYVPTITFNATTQWFFLSLLGALQLITIAWFVMICRVVARVLQGHGADDSRSDDEGGEDEEEDLTVYEPKQPTSALPSPTSTLPTTMPYTLRCSDPHQASAGAERFIEVTASSEDLKFTPRSSSSTAGRKRKGKGGISSGLNLGEHKEILNRIGCLSDEQLARERELRSGKEREGSPSLGNGAARTGRRK